MDQRLLVVSPVRNEAAHIESVALALAAQTRRPDLWLVVDDESTDETPQILAQVARRLEFMEVINSRPHADGEAPRDRLAVAAPPKAFNVGLQNAGWQSFTHIAKLDGDIELPPHYFEQVLGEFRRDATLGLAGGVLEERDGTDWGEAHAANDYHIRGALKCYSRDCLEAIGGIQERLAWDAIDEIYARMRGYRTRTLSRLVARHHRPTASADGILRGRARHGQCAYIVRFTLPWVTLRAFKVAAERPRALSGFAFLYGYLRSALLRVPRVDDPEFHSFVRRELRERLRLELAGRVPRGERLVSVASRER